MTTMGNGRDLGYGSQESRKCVRIPNRIVVKKSRVKGIY